MPSLQRCRYRQSGFSYIEVIIATVILTISLVPAMEALSTAQKGSQINTELQQQHYALLEKFELTLAEPFSALDSEAVSLADNNTPSTVFSDPGSAAHRCLVYIQRFDGDNADGDDDAFTGGDKDLLWLKVQVEGSALFKETLVTTH